MLLWKLKLHLLELNLLRARNRLLGWAQAQVTVIISHKPTFCTFFHFTEFWACATISQIGRALKWNWCLTSKQCFACSYLKMTSRARLIALFLGWWLPSWCSYGSWSSIYWNWIFCERAKDFSVKRTLKLEWFFLIEQRFARSFIILNLQRAGQAARSVARSN